METDNDQAKEDPWHLHGHFPAAPNLVDDTTTLQNPVRVDCHVQASVLVQRSKTHSQYKTAQVLLDTGASSSLISKWIVPHNVAVVTAKVKKWMTMTGAFTTPEHVTVTVQFPQLTKNREVVAKFNVSPESLGEYDMIVG